MLMTPEQLKEHWLTLNAPGCFDPNETNWTDLTVSELRESVSHNLTTNIYGNYYDGFYRVARENLPQIAKPAPYIPSTALADIFDQWELSSQIKQALPFLDPEDRLYFRSRTGNHITIIKHFGSLNTAFWNKCWGLQIDNASHVPEFEGQEEKARALIYPQKVRTQHRSKNYPEIYMINRESLSTYPAVPNEHARAILVDSWLLHSKFLFVPRLNEYPMSITTKDKVIEATSEVIARDAIYGKGYLEGLTQVYSYARKNKIELPEAFAATES